MASVTFSPSVGGDGSTVTDDSSPTTGLGNGGHRTRFVPALAQLVAVASNAVASAAAALAYRDTTLGYRDTTLTFRDAANASFLAVDKKYLGSKASAPTLDNQGAALAVGAQYFNSTNQNSYIWSGSVWTLQTFVPTAATGVTVTATGYISAGTVQTALAQIGAKKYSGDSIFLANNFGGF